MDNVNIWTVPAAAALVRTVWGGDDTGPIGVRRRGRRAFLGAFEGRVGPTCVYTLGGIYLARSSGRTSVEIRSEGGIVSLVKIRSSSAGRLARVLAAFVLIFVGWELGGGWRGPMTAKFQHFLSLT